MQVKHSTTLLVFCLNNKLTFEYIHLNIYSDQALPSLAVKTFQVKTSWFIFKVWCDLDKSFVQRLPIFRHGEWGEVTNLKHKCPTVAVIVLTTHILQNKIQNTLVICSTIVKIHKIWWQPLHHNLSQQPLRILIL